MKLQLFNSPSGLIPLYDSDFEEKKKLKVGVVYTAEIRVPRNYQFHKKFFALINAGYSLLPERTQHGFRSVEGFRQYVLVAAGFYETFFHPRLHQFVEIPRSISFASMDEAEFDDCYNAVKNTIFALLGDRVNEQTFEQYLSNF